jgi:hypothetical protein
MSIPAVKTMAMPQPRTVCHDQPRSSRNSGSTASMTSPWVRTIAAAPTSRPATSAIHHAGRGFQSSSSVPTISRKVKTVSAMIRCSSSMMYPSSSCGSVAMAAHVFGTPLRRSST